MKTIYEILHPFGCKTTEVAEDFETKFPYTEVEPDANRDLMLQFFDVKLNVWRPVEYMASTEKISLLENFYTKATADVKTLTKQNEVLNDQLTDTQLALAEVYEMLVPDDAAQEVVQMANIYVNLIQKGLKTIEEVPRTIRNEVQAILDAETADQDCFLFTQKGGGRDGCSICDFNY